MKKIKIVIDKIGAVSAEIRDEKNPKTAEAIWKALPIESSTNTWGDEIYFNIPLSVDEENSQEEVEVGDIGYWPPGHAFCIFFGRTPASRDKNPRAASPVNIFGKITGDMNILEKAKGGEKIRVETAESP